MHKFQCIYTERQSCLIMIHWVAHHYFDLESASVWFEKSLEMVLYFAKKKNTQNNSSVWSDNSSNICCYGDQIFLSSSRQYGRLSTRSIPAQFDDENRSFWSAFHFEFMLQFDWLTFRIKTDHFDPPANPIRKQKHWDKQSLSKNFEPMMCVECCHCVLRRSDHENNKIHEKQVGAIAV